mmetsp:Transcript_22665/g.35593  ORF Transcript_22665/g.35593 Transcript_22665/m.35593 type:complete len:168 (+) Transcript_22665:649-1152(+)
MGSQAADQAGVATRLQVMGVEGGEEGTDRAEDMEDTTTEADMTMEGMVVSMERNTDTVDTAGHHLLVRLHPSRILSTLQPILRRSRAFSSGSQPIQGVTHLLHPQQCLWTAPLRKQLAIQNTALLRMGGMGREADMVAGPVGTTDPSTLTVKRKSFLTMGNTGLSVC